VDERASLLAAYVDVLAEERHDPFLRLHRLRHREELVTRNELIALVGADQVRRLEGWIGSPGSVPWGLVASFLGLEGDEAVSFVAKREREPEVMRQRRALEEEEAAMTLAAFSKKQGRARVSPDVKGDHDDVKARVQERSDAERSLAAAARISRWARRRWDVRLQGRRGKNRRIKRGRREAPTNGATRESQAPSKRRRAASRAL
jgi:hypothetical protein